MSNSKSNIQIFFYALLLSAVFWSCNPDMNPNPTITYTPQVENNSFTDDNMLQKIATLQDNRNVNELLSYIDNPYAEYREACAIAFASIQDSSVVRSLAPLLQDSKVKVRIAATYAIGQIGASSGEQLLINAYENENSDIVKKQILESIGKCGTNKGVVFLCSLPIDRDKETLMLGQAWGLSRYSIRGIVTRQSSAKAAEILTNSTSKKVKFVISHYFALNENIDLSSYRATLKSEFQTTNDINLKINLTTAIGKMQNEKALSFLHTVLESDYDNKIKIRAIEACYNYNYYSSKAIMFSFITHENNNIALLASRFFIKNGVQEDANEYLQKAKNVNSWQTRANMLTAALRYSDEKESISNSIKSGYKLTDNIFEKASLLYALSGDPSQYKFVQNETFYNNNKIISTAGIRALYKMRLNSNFDKFYNEVYEKTGDDLYVEFSLIFKQAIQSQDNAKVYYGAKILQQKDLEFREMYDNTYFIKQALSNCYLPRDLEAYLELSKALKFINGEDAEYTKSFNYRKINWKRISGLDPNHQAIIKTSKGDILIELHVNKAPAAVSNFIHLIQEEYYNDSYFFRVMPDYIAQTGCKRGDGWGTANYAIRTEFYPSYIKEGSIAMSSIGKDTESVQWFISQFPSAELDGQYTVFASVVKGMDIVNQIEVSDKINSIVLL